MCGRDSGFGIRDLINTSLFAPRTSTYDFRDGEGKLLLPKPRTDYLKRSFSYRGALLWNNLPEEVGTATSSDLFNRSTHRWFSEQHSHVRIREICETVVENFYLFSM